MNVQTRHRVGTLALALSLAAFGCDNGGAETDAGGGDAGVATSGVTVDPTSGLMTNEGGGSATFTIVLDGAPTADVTIEISSSDESEGTVSPASFVFTSDNWNAPQTATVTGQDDDETDGTVAYMVITSAAASSDSNYDGLAVDDVRLGNADDDTAGVTVSPTSGLRVTEGGDSDEFTIVLNAQPTQDVTIALSSSDSGEGTASPSGLTFTADNWDAPQTVTVTGADDAEVDGDIEFSIVTEAASSDDDAYDGLDADDVSVTNIDDESAGVMVMADADLTTSEAGATAMFMVVLNSAPRADAVVSVSSSDDSEGTVSPATLTFTTANWDAPQAVTVTGVDDAIADGNQPYNVVLSEVSSADPDYDGVDPDDVAIINIDDDSAGVTVDPVDGLSVAEAGDSDTFTVVLNSRPTASVLFTISSDDVSEGTVSPTNIIFTTDNWNAPQTITVHGEDDSDADGNQVFMVRVEAATSPDPEYNLIDPPDVEVTNVDDDSAGVSVEAPATLATSEAGGEDTLTIVLNSRPTADVSFAIGSSDESEGMVSPTSVTFTADNWNAPRTVTVTGVDDASADGNQSYDVTISAATSDDTDYMGIDPADIPASNVDNDSAGITVEPTVGLTTTEAGGAASFTVVLNSRPSSEVSIPVASSNESEGQIGVSELVFTVDNWNAPQEIVVVGQADSVFDGDQPYSIITGLAVSMDGDYAGIDPLNVALTNLDADPGVIVSPTSGLRTAEAGASASFTVVLNVAPTADVRVSLASDDNSEGSVSPVALTFTSENWDAPQTVTVRGVDDPIADGDQPFTIVTGATSSTQPAYNGLEVDDVEVVNEDDETPGVIVTHIGPLETTEGGGTHLFRLALRAQPTSDVTVGVSSTDTSEGTVDRALVTFNAMNWSAPQTITITGIDDLIADGNQPYTIDLAAAMSLDMAYDGLEVPNFTMTNFDDETAGFEVTPLSVQTREDGGATPSFRVRLRSEPTHDVVIPIASTDEGEGEASAESLTFTSDNWNAFQLVSVSGADDAVADGDQPYTIELRPAMSADETYNGLDPVDVAATNVDDDSPGITVRAGRVLTDEGGGTSQFEVRLDSQPTADVTIGVSSLDPTEASVSPSSLTFTSENWNAPQSVTVHGEDDAVADGDITFTIVLAPASSSDSGYNGLDPDDVTGVNNDDETAGVTVEPVSGLVVTESGGTDTFTVVLDSEPTADVTIGLSSSDTAEGSVSPASLTFTPANWDAPQTVTVIGVDDFVADGTQTFFVVTAAASSADGNYNHFSVSDVQVDCEDDESPGVTVTPANDPLRTSEGGDADTFTIRLTSQPTNAVVIGLSSSAPGEGRATQASVTFTAANWNAPQTVTVVGEDDFTADGAQDYTIITADAMSADPNYNNLVVPDVAARNTDNETPGITVRPTGGLLTNEAGTVVDSFTVQLDSQPSDPVSIPIASTDPSEGAPMATMLVFTAANWDIPQTVNVVGANDFVADGNQPYDVTVGPATSDDDDYEGLSGASVSLTNLDDETPGFTVMPITDLVTSENGLAADFSVVLNSQPTAAVTILFSWDMSEGSLSTSMLSFDSSNWNRPQTVTVTGVDDALSDGSQAYNVSGDPSGSADGNYAALPSFTVRVINIDND